MVTAKKKSLFSAVLVATTLLLNYTEKPNKAQAETCASHCPPPPLEFIPGKLINVEVVNHTGKLVFLVEKVAFTRPIPLQPGYQMRFKRSTTTEPNFSMMFWEPTTLTLTARLSKPNDHTLRVEIIPGGNPGDRTVYIKDDGRLMVF